ncbi:hypothetical protein [Dictyobacter aurantiacus]|uniref:DUF732 domain-containing protein n=1 Tax=Dictyobacter aurantiacus TaxID=1936993 RepID=A0A401ZIG2_9CHLR|nr:hypothetical protein [Dictyobacter aurantiacus]GCE06630.1 hypothetical protein KDAU_39590 [Dictyobacter aurantiacus]
MLKLLAIVKGKIVLATIGSMILIGSATAAFAATPTGGQFVQSIIHASPTVALTTASDKKSENKPTSTPGNQKGSDHSSCPGLPDIQNLATKYNLSTSSSGDAVKDICALHQGTFTATTASGAAIKVSHVYGNGEIDQVLAYAQYLASKDGTKLNDTNVTRYLAAVLKSCGTSPLEVCLKTNIPNYKPGNSDNYNNGNKPTATPTNSGNRPTATPSANGSRPTATPTDNGNRPTATPTDNGNRPTATPTVH